MEEKKIGDIKAELEAAELANLQLFIDSYQVDTRGGVQKLVATAAKRLEKYEAELARTENLKKYEREYEAFAYIAGIDEVGRGPLAGL